MTENKPSPAREARPEPVKKLDPKTVLTAKEIREIQQEEARLKPEKFHFTFKVD